ncbi:MAG: Ig-like domain-containing protein [Muribaculaceae bacterium]|nr:Ig-like domain-containing protein [Muribaculaceae bacterium]
MKIFTRFISILTLAALPVMVAAQAVPVESVTILVSNKPAKEGKLAVAGSRTFTAQVLPENATDKTVTWSISNPAIASQDATNPAKFRGMTPGTAVITAEAGGVKATYTLSVSLKDAKVGQYYFADNTWEDSGIVPGKTCIGVIFYLNSDKRSGKIVSLDEAPSLKWSSATAPAPGATAALNGLANLKKIQTVDGWKDKFDAEAWCASKTEGGLQWYLPAVDELRQLFAASCGLTWVESGANETNKEINNWTGASQTMLPGDNIDPYPTERAAFNKKFTNIGATAFAADKYWSSTQTNEDFAQFLSFEGGYSNMQPKQYFHVCRTRAIAEFAEKQTTTGITDITINQASRMTLSLNPVISETTVHCNVDITAISIYSLSGTLMPFIADINGTEATLNVATLPTGTYIVVAHCADGTMSTAKLIKR